MDGEFKALLILVMGSSLLGLGFLYILRLVRGRLFPDTRKPRLILDYGSSSTTDGVFWKWECEKSLDGKVIRQTLRAGVPTVAHCKAVRVDEMDVYERYLEPDDVMEQTTWLSGPYQLKSGDADGMRRLKAAVSTLAEHLQSQPAASQAGRLSIRYAMEPLAWFQEGASGSLITFQLNYENDSRLFREDAVVPLFLKSLKIVAP